MPGYEDRNSLSRSTNKSRDKYIRHLLRDFFIVAGSIAAALLLVEAGALHSFLSATQGFKLFASFVAGAFFTSILTVAPATVALVAISESYAPIFVAFWGALGAGVVDHFIFKFVREDVTEDVEGLLKPKMRRYVISLFHFGFMKWIAIAVGAFMIATPLPDELGLTLLGFTKASPRAIAFYTFIMHFLGIFVLTTIARAVI